MRQAGTIFCILLLAGLALAGQPNVAKSDQTDAISAPALINYQGKLTDGAGNPIEGTKHFVFSIYADSTGGTAVWGPEDWPTVLVTKGLFNVILGANTTGGITTLPDGPGCYLDIKVEDAAITPRVRLVSAPYSLKAQAADDAANLGGVPAASYATQSWANATFSPLGHTHSQYELSANKGVANGYAGLNASAKLALGTIDQGGAGSGQVLTWNGSAWAPATSSGGVTGSGTANYNARWTGSTSLGNGAMQDNGTSVSVGTSPSSYYAVYGYSGSYTGIYGYSGSSSASYAGVYGYSSYYGVTGYNSNYSTYGRLGNYSPVAGVYGYGGTNTSYYGVYGYGYNGVFGYSSYAGTYGVVGAYNGGSYAGVYGYGASYYAGYFNNGGTNPTVYAYNSSYSVRGELGSYNSGYPAAVYGYGSSYYGVYGYSSGSGYAGVYGYTNSGSGTSYRGVYGAGPYVGVMGVATNYSTWGVLGYGASSPYCGVYGYASSNGYYGVYGYNNYSSTSTYGVFGHGYYGGVAGHNTLYNYYSVMPYQSYKIMGSGSVSTYIVDENNDQRVLHCPETPEVLFEDVGSNHLSNGYCHVNIDPLLLRGVVIDAENPLRVFVTTNGECNGVHVVKHDTYFEVVENGNGRSNVAFDWRLVANRKGFQNQRFENIGSLPPGISTKGPMEVEPNVKKTPYVQ